MYAVYNKKTGEECVLLHQVDVREMLESEEWSMQKPEENLVKRKTTKKVAEKTNG